MITLIEQRYSLKSGTKTVYTLDSEETKGITSQQYKRYEESAPYFRRMGGTETIKRDYTSQGYKMVKLTSKSPDKETKIIRTFKFN